MYLNQKRDRHLCELKKSSGQPLFSFSRNQHLQIPTLNPKAQEKIYIKLKFYP